MSRLSPPNEQEFRTAVARVINMPEYKIILGYLDFRLDQLKNALVESNAVDVPKLQGRASELVDLKDQLTKRKE